MICIFQLFLIMDDKDKSKEQLVSEILALKKENCRLMESISPDTAGQNILYFNLPEQLIEGKTFSAMAPQQNVPVLMVNKVSDLNCSFVRILLKSMEGNL